MWIFANSKIKFNFKIEVDEEINAVQDLAIKGVCSESGESTLTPEIIFCPGCGSANLAASPIVAYYCIAEVDCNTLCHYQDKYCLSCRYELPGDAMKLCEALDEGMLDVEILVRAYQFEKILKSKERPKGWKRILEMYDDIRRFGDLEDL